MDNNLYRTLVEQFAIYDKSDLEEIINDKNASEEEIAAARYILSGKSPEANNYKEQMEEDLINASNAVLATNIAALAVSNNLTLGSLIRGGYGRNFNIDNVRFEKVIIATDADLD